jgi:hypothetical protein
LFLNWLVGLSRGEQDRPTGVETVPIPPRPRWATTRPSRGPTPRARKHELHRRLLNDVRAEIDAHPTPLAAARTRLNLVLGTAGAALRTYRSGSLPQNTFIHPVGDGDGGLVLDRRIYPCLGPDGDGETPVEITTELCGLLGPAMREYYPNARCGTSKRGPKISFSEPVDGQDPTVDLVVALTRKDGPGLWIPNLERNSWEPSDPERHVELFSSGTESLRRTRRRVVRLLKAWNKQYGQPGFSSHNLTVWAWEFIEPGMGLVACLPLSGQGT